MLQNVTYDLLYGDFSKQSLSRRANQLPLPEIFTLCGLFGALSVMLTAALRMPIAFGVKVTVIVQLPPATMLVPQLLV